MRINKVQLKNFKRFTDLTLDSIPPGAKLVLLIGSNGSGKSSVFDGFYVIDRPMVEHDYYLKSSGSVEIDVNFSNGDSISSKLDPNGRSQTIPAHHPKFIGRSSIRIIPRISNDANPDQIKNDADRPNTSMDPDTRLPNDVSAYMQEIDNQLRAPVFQGKAADTLKIFNDFISPFNTSLLNIFGENVSTTIQIAKYQNSTPYSAGQLIFRKGEAEINYDLLSHGEKQVVILLLNFIVRREQYKDAIIFIDEMDCHLNTSLQSRLLEEIVTKWIPDSSQLWTASHALGFIDYARKSEQAVILDFDNLNFDVPQIIQPQPKDDIDVYEVAIPKTILFNILKDKKIILCENKNDEYYNLMQLKDTLFVGVKDARDVFINVKRDNRYFGLRDRDFLSGTEIGKIHIAYPNYFLLQYYDFENYLYHPDNIARLNIDGFDIEAYRQEIIKQKNERKDYILPALISSRQGYEEFKTNEQFKDANINSIVDDLRSDEFDRFYKYFDMKVEFRKNILSGYNIDKKELVKTTWFKEQIEAVLR